METGLRPGAVGNFISITVLTGTPGNSAAKGCPWYIGIENASIHDIRHSFSSRPLAPRESLSMIGNLLDYMTIDTTSRYAQCVGDSIAASSVRVIDTIGADILDRKSPRTAALLWLLGRSSAPRIVSISAKFGGGRRRAHNHFRASVRLMAKARSPIVRKLLGNNIYT